MNEYTDQRWSFRCPNCGAFKVVDLRVYPGGRIEQVRMVVHEIRRTFEVLTGVGGRLRPAPTAYQAIEATETTMRGERTCACGTLVKGEVVTGRFSRESVCDDRCTAAVGDDCECQCGGANHGVAWVGLGWRLLFTPDGKRAAKRPDVTVAATPELARQAAEARKAERARRAAAKEAKFQEAAARTMRSVREAFLAEHGGLVEWLSVNHADDEFLTSLQEWLDRRGHLTPAQITSVERAMARAQQRAQEAEVLKGSPLAPEGAATVEGEIVSIKERAGFRGATEFKMTVRLDDGNRVWLSLPDELYRAVRFSSDLDEHWTVQLEGRRTRLTATFTRSDRDEHFAFGKRPRNAVLLPKEMS